MKSYAQKSSNLKTLPPWEGSFSNEGFLVISRSLFKEVRKMPEPEKYFQDEKRFSDQLQINSDKIKLRIFILWLVCSYSFSNMVYQTNSRINSY